ncbi:D-2-hydroxyacid dehydrogenase [Robiginitalea sp. M366]|uniref:D-2-hydroxyacid dehydrogenase n=1 Tax=Robiginitalea aestuariiviva TaxID=3036903 RepID=UPI00240D626E|nr:D-2-hydroxyacid dehydrogenase [Robiginitalea aestuariiviva]MDG1573003.1 D-2-hydroxyacid dehydrogenase [Robiginitalea aestuariiviva]
MRVLANDGISDAGKERLEAAGFEVLTTRVAQEQLTAFLDREKIAALLVRSATQVTPEVIDAAGHLKIIGRAGVGLDNIAVEHARKKGIPVINTPGASADSVAELVFAHLMGGVRFLHDSNRQMPLEGDQIFKQLKKQYSKGTEVKGKTMGIVGFGRIGKAVAQRALGLGMKVVFADPEVTHAQVSLEFADGQRLHFDVQGAPFREVLAMCDFLSLHVPAQDKPLIGEKELGLMKRGAAIINTSRGGVLDEPALLQALEAGHIRFAALDVFTSEPAPEVQLLMHPQLSLSPHIGAATREAQDRIGLELADQLIAWHKNGFQEA